MIGQTQEIRRMAASPVYFPVAAGAIVILLATMIRLFVAIMPPATVRAELARLAVALNGVRWTPEENIHLTLRFIGETTPEKQTAFEDALLRVAVEPFVLPVGDVGVFPSRGSARVLWAGVGQGHTRLYQLRKQVDEALLTVEPGLAMPSFHPHFTLARLNGDLAQTALARFFKTHRSFDAPPFSVTEFVLIASERQPGGPTAYRVLRRFTLAA